MVGSQTVPFYGFGKILRCTGSFIEAIAEIVLRPYIALFGSQAVPFDRFHIVLRRACSVVATIAKVVLCPKIPRFSSLTKPLGGFDAVFCHAAALRIHPAEQPLRFAIAVFRHRQHSGKSCFEQLASLRFMLIRLG